MTFHCTIKSHPDSGHLPEGEVSFGQHETAGVLCLNADSVTLSQRLMNGGAALLFHGKLCLAALYLLQARCQWFRVIVQVDTRVHMTRLVIERHLAEYKKNQTHPTLHTLCKCHKISTEINKTEGRNNRKQNEQNFM